MSEEIKLVLQAAENGNRRDVPGNWTPKATLAEIMDSMQSDLQGVSLQNATIRYLQIIIHQDRWSVTTLKSIGLSQGGRALLVLKLGTTPFETPLYPQQTQLAKSPQEKLEIALASLLNNNFDVDTKACIIVILKVLDNVLQKPQDMKVRSIRLANPVFSKKVLERKGGVEFLIACGFEVQANQPELLSHMEIGERCLVLTKDREDTDHLTMARRLLMTRAMQDLNMKAEELPKFKPPPRLTDAGDHAAGRSPSTTSSQEFNPYKGHRHDAMSAAMGQRLGPDSNYVSPTEQQLQALHSQQKKLESSMHKPILDREIVASLPKTPQMNLLSTISQTPEAPAPSDGSIIASQFAKREQDRRLQESKGFSTKAMRDLERLKKQKIYSHAQVRVQFSDGSALEAKFLPKETVEAVKMVVEESLLINDLEFDLYVAPPRRKLNLSRTLEDEGLVPASKIFLSWTPKASPSKGSPVGSFLRPELFRDGCVPEYPSAQTLVHDNDEQGTTKTSKPPATESKSTREEDLVRRMMGQSDRLSGEGKGVGKPGGKPKWFK